jgi:hypothetical protein
MKKIPTRYELSEKDIKEAITYWLNQCYEDDDGYEFTIHLSAEIQGLSTNFNEKANTSITAVAIKE